MRLLKTFCISVLLIVAACTTNEAPTPIPTQILIPSTATPTPQPIIPTTTPRDLPSPDDLQPTPTPQAFQPLLDSAIAIDADIVTAVVNVLADEIASAPNQIQLADVQEAVWLNDNLGCSSRRSLGQAIEGYAVLLLVGTRTYQVHTNQDATVIRRCAGSDMLRGDLLLAVDPVAAELTALARRQSAQNSDVPLDEIELVDVFPVTWSDTSLGCPQSGQDYAPLQIDGYRILLQVGEETVTFHTDSVELIPCPAGSEQLP